MPLYFAYGSNLHWPQMRRRCPSSRVVGRATLADHRLGFPVISQGDWHGGVAGIHAAAGEAVEGVVYDVSDDDLITLDRYEAVAEGLYRRAIVTVSLVDGGSAKVLTYYANGDDPAAHPPSRRYLDTIIEGARHHGLTAAYLKILQGFVCCDG